jgi:hypothetical protein
VDIIQPPAGMFWARQVREKRIPLALSPGAPAQLLMCQSAGTVTAEKVCDPTQPRDGQNATDAMMGQVCCCGQYTLAPLLSTRGMPPLGQQCVTPSLPWTVVPWPAQAAPAQLA